jgi:hypothetical protein
MKNFNIKRSELKVLSKGLRILVNEGMIATINEGLRNIYKENGHGQLNTLKQWNQLGMAVRKGEKALLLWGQPKQIEKVNNETKEMDEFDFFPICYVFSDKQVISRRAE